MSGSKLEIQCAACGEESLLRREPVFEGLRKAGERLSCAACGHVYASEAEVPYKVRAQQRVFTEADRPVTPEVFAADERQRCCRYCKHYVINPFTQWCGVHRREVEATYGCDRFARKPEEKAKPKLEI